MTKVLIVGLGDLGAETARRLAQSGIQVVGLRRTVAAAMEQSANDGTGMIAADVTQPSTLTGLESLCPDMIVYCVAAGGQTDAEYKAAYVDGLRNVLATQVNNSRLKHVFFVSSSRVYGQDSQALLDENTPALPADFGGQRLLEAEHLLQALPCGTTVLRLSGIYGPGRLRMLNLAKSPGHWPKQNTWSNRIHRDDAAAFIAFLIHQVLAGSTVQSCYIVTDSRPVPQYEVLSWLAAQLQMPKPAQLPASAGKRLSNSNMLATGFKLQYADYEAGYRTLLPPIPD
ncbi:SDR family oxidoreductase [Methylotenera sp. G11]|uniref:SDR family oxidoreductase n=1 Tax=Methylotenera sp. G11 TaxID=1506585 RepID=UPI000647EE7C|nr:SDR family oxidoreductase [Methylotenera sp. G11]